MTKKVYMGFSTDVLHGGHMAIIQKAASLGELTIGMLSDEAIVSFKRFPILNYTERVKLVEAIKGVHTVVQQATLSYAENLRKYKPDIVVHGDNWKSGPQKAIRDEVIEILKEYGGELVETAYADNPAYEAFEAEQRKILSMPDQRRGRLKKLLEMKPLVSIMEAHSGITGLIVEKTIVTEEGKTHQFDGMWSSSLCDSTSKGKPDIELLDMSTRFKTLDEIMDVTTKPIIVDGDTGGQTEHFVYNIRTMERMGVSAVIIEDKTGLKKNSLFGTDVEQTQDSIENFSAKLKAGRAALKSNDFLLIARIESLILDKGMEDALERAFAFTKAGAHGIMIHSRKKDPSEIFEFCDKFRAIDKTSPLVVVPTSFNSVTEEEFAARGVNIVIYANQFTRSGFPAMKHVAETILSTHRAKEADDLCMSIKEILTLIPEEF
jgi:phosphoenolpyruvate mutase